MSHGTPSGPPAGTPADALRSWADAERTRGAELADVLEDFAANGLPDVDDLPLWEGVRDVRLAALADQERRPRVA
ncbi:hypothetical protein [Kitasatospora sp. NPDC088783]|uniref:hypothetical protein n=1 Tax=Kitasatospora sp. NPDC088783 TaxID=3364077 RepID=UPI00381138A2